MAIVKHIAVHRSPLKLIQYILNGNKTDEMKFATGLNCSTDPESAYEEMGNTFEHFAKERFYKKSLNNENCGKEKIRLLYCDYSHVDPTDGNKFINLLRAEDFTLKPPEKLAVLHWTLFTGYVQTRRILCSFTAA